MCTKQPINFKERTNFHDKLVVDTVAPLVELHLFGIRLGAKQITGQPGAAAMQGGKNPLSPLLFPAKSCLSDYVICYLNQLSEP